MSNLPAVPFNEMQAMALAVAKSNLFGMKTPDQALALMLLSQAEGLHPALAARDYHVIQGRPALKADAMLARFQRAGGTVKWDKYTDDAVCATFSHPQGGTLTVEWTWEMATAAGLTNKDNWKAYPRAMLRSRVISEGIRTVYPGVAVGIYTDEETENFNAKGPIVDVKSTVEPSPAQKEAPKAIEELLNPPKADDAKAARKAVLSQLKAVMEQSGIPKEHMTATALDMFGKSSAGDLTTEELAALVDVFKPAKESENA